VIPWNLSCGNQTSRRQPHLTSSHTLTSKSHHPLQCFPFHVIQSLLLLLDFETNFVAGNKNQQKSTETQHINNKNQFCDRDRKVVGQVRTANLSGMFIEMQLRNSHT
jgi:hypothetical protein